MFISNGVVPSAFSTSLIHPFSRSLSLPCSLISYQCLTQYILNHGTREQFYIDLYVFRCLYVSVTMLFAKWQSQSNHLKTLKISLIRFFPSYVLFLSLFIQGKSRENRLCRMIICAECAYDNEISYRYHSS